MTTQADIARTIRTFMITRYAASQLRNPVGPGGGRFKSEFGGLHIDDLLNRFHEESIKADPDTGRLHLLYREIGKREKRARKDAPQREKLEQLIKQGKDYRTAYAEAYDLSSDELDRQERAALVDASRAPGESRDQTVRRLYSETVDLAYLQAEQATRGNVLTAAGKRAGIDARSLFSGPRARARKYASDELKQWWEDNTRQTYTEFRAAMLGRAADKAKAKAAVGAGNSKDFGI